MTAEHGQSGRAPRFGAWLRHWWIAIAAAVIGVAVLGLSWLMADRFDGETSAWLESVLTNVGAAILLVAPIAWVSERLTAQVETVRENVEVVRADVEDSRVETAAVRDDVRRVREETVQTVDELRQEVASLRELGDQVRERRAAELRREDQAYRRIGLDGTVPQRKDVVEALRIAQENGVIDERYGPRAELEAGSGVYLRLRYEPNDCGETDLFFDVMTPEGWLRRSVPWDDDDTPIQEPLFDVTKVLRLEGTNPDFDVSDWLRRISHTLVVGASHMERHNIIELHEPQWAVTTEGVTSYPDRVSSLGPEQFDYHEIMASVSQEEWVNMGALDRAVDAWKSLFTRSGPWGDPTSLRT